MVSNTYVEEAEYVVKAVLTTNISFSPIPRERPITRQDAIDNAIGSMPDDFWRKVEEEGWSVEFQAESY